MGIFSKINVVIRWNARLVGMKSLLNAIKLHYMGRSGGADCDKLLPLRPAASPLTIWCRPKTSDFITFQEIFFGGEYAAALRLLPADVRVILDLGSNIGCSLAYLHGQWPHAELVGVEPDQGNMSMIRRTLNPLLEIGQLKLFHCFIGASPREAVLRQAGAGGSNEYVMTEASAADTATAERIPVRTVPDLLQQTGHSSVDLLKCDIEGAERELFEHCREWINRVRYLVLELHNGMDARWLINTAASQGAKLTLLEEQQKGEGLWLVWLKNDTAQIAAI